MNMILQSQPFDVASITYTSNSSALDGSESAFNFQEPPKLVLILSSLVVKIFLNNGVDMLSADSTTYRMEPFTDTIMRSVSARLEQLSSPKSQE